MINTSTSHSKCTVPHILEKLFYTALANKFFRWIFGRYVGEIGVHSVTGHMLSAGFSRKLSSVGTLLLCKICLSLLGMVWYYQKIDIAMNRFVKIGKVCFCYGDPNFLK